MSRNPVSGGVDVCLGQVGGMYSLPYDLYIGKTSLSPGMKSTVRIGDRYISRAAFQAPKYSPGKSLDGKM